MMNQRAPNGGNHTINMKSEPNTARPTRLHDHHTIHSGPSISTPNPAKVGANASSKPRKRRTLPTPPVPSRDTYQNHMAHQVDLNANHTTPQKSTMKSSHSPEHVRTNGDPDLDIVHHDGIGAVSSVPLPPAQKCPYFCTSEGPKTNQFCAHCELHFCGACFHSAEGLMQIRAGQKSTFKCARCGHNPFHVKIEERPPWAGDDHSSIPGSTPAFYQPSAKKDAIYTHFFDKDFISSLRVTEEPKKKKVLKKNQDENLPEVFNRLTDVRKFPKRHKNRFDEQGHGLGLEGSREASEESLNHNLRGTPLITRETIPEFDSPNRPRLASSSRPNSRPVSALSSRPNSRASARPLTPAKQSLYDRLSKPKHKEETAYEKEIRLRHALGAAPDSVLRFQS
eukprot:m.129368 g.129368  ORF g.129368 m.129368 type:complete len:395 (+) comp23637_c0_seq1:38-1222(+)